MKDVIATGRLKELYSPTKNQYCSKIKTASILFHIFVFNIPIKTTAVVARELVLSFKSSDGIVIGS